MSNKAVILGCNYYIGLSVIRCLGMEGVHTVAVDYSEKQAYGADSKYTSERLIVPHYHKDPDAFVAHLIDFAQKESAPPVLIPCHDSYLEVVDMYLPELRKYYLIPQDVQGIYTNTMNKERLYEMAAENGVAVPEIVRINEDNFIGKVDRLIKFPCIVKPTDSPSFVSKFRRKLFKVNNHNELEWALNQAGEAGLEVFVQRIIPGFDDHMYTFDAYLDQQSNVTHWATCQKFRQYPINFGASVYTGQRYIPELHEIGASFLEKIKWKGFAEIEFKKDAETGKYYLIEVNCRMTNLNNLLYKLGLNMPWITYQELTKGIPVASKAITEDTRYTFWYGYEDLLAVRDYLKNKQLTLLQVLRSLARPKAYAIWDWKDPKPAVSHFSIIAKKFARKILLK
ncbi:carboxylate--amine ligase [Paenibacillus sp. VMFN-D1]|uniref:carboxylate--amine ligase n=1 Tax=Paenibacillus sp. VMFN-D1 TaxID=2135608 RepID=UPI000E2339CF|nr:carboxylate--amine ligase [Paenibacillus sp. VMFN-D1]RED37381.1 putative ATP-grasp superfamily ATP-dependent carboligase [Paenibacillus sp. VMFN-D1]